MVVSGSLARHTHRHASVNWLLVFLSGHTIYESRLGSHVEGYWVTSGVLSLLLLPPGLHGAGDELGGVPPLRAAVPSASACILSTIWSTEARNGA